MDKNFKNKISVFVFLIVVYLISLPSYYSYLPTIPIYNNDESKIVKKMTQDRNSDDINFFHLTNKSSLMVRTQC